MRYQEIARRIALHITVAFTALGPAMPGVAQSGDIPPVAVHGFLSQAVARAWQQPIAGIPQEVTLDYRAVALQIAYRASDADKLVLQFSHRRLGASALDADASDVKLDWGFYQHGVGTGAIRVGRVPLPRGLFNEIRDVGTALPFYRAPIHVYSDAGENFEGVALRYRFFADKPWSMHAEVYGGAYDFDYVRQQPSGPIVETVAARAVHGMQLWLETPVRGVRAGFGGIRYRQKGTGDDFYYSWITSFESIIDRVTVRAEYTRATSAFYGWNASYGQVGIRVLPNVMLSAQAEFADVTAYTPFGDLEVDWGRDHIAGITWMVRSNAAVKLEAHRTHGHAYDAYTPMDGPPVRGSYAIASIAVGF